MWTAKKLRKEFISFFEKRKHTHWRSSSVLPDDKTLLFTNSGMVQFKKKFLDLADSSTEYGNLTRACNYQKCIRAGGKHNDLDDVGKDTYHHTFFEMLGNWSFGDYFKEEAIDMAWEFLTEVLKLDKSRLYVSYFKGDPAQHIPEDTEAKRIWEKHITDKSHILEFGAKENFWEMGSTGPCGPCTEIHYDRVGGRDASSLVNQDDPDVVEIWNVVFIQYNREEEALLTSLPKKHIDTGMGLERVLSILQDQKSNYNTELFLPLFAKIREVMDVPPYTDTLESKLDVAYRVIADHSRTLAVSLMDGILPSHEGRGYVVRRILRRALGFQYQHMKKEPGLLPLLVRMSFEELSEAYPTHASVEKVCQVIHEEETQFTKTLSKGLSILTAKIEEVKRKEAECTLSGKDAFILYDRYGFPIDLTQAVAEQEKVQVDMEGFQKEQSTAKELSKGKGKHDSGLSLSVHDLFVLEKATRNTPTDDSFKYAGTRVQSRVLGIKVSGEIVALEDLSAYKDVPECGLVLEKTAFYSEAGGQEGDRGCVLLSTAETAETVAERVGTLSLAPARFTVQDTKKYGKYVLHIGQLEGPLLPYGTCDVDMKRRKKLAVSHTSTHLLNFAVVKTLSAGEGAEEIQQCGSLVSEDRLRFDFSWGQALTPEQIEGIESTVNRIVGAKEDVHVKNMPYSEAQSIKGLRMMKGEEYPEVVRVILVGERPLEVEEDVAHSAELCGGTHVGNTAEIERVRIVSEESVARGIRRLSALCGAQALRAEEEARALLARPLSTSTDADALKDLFEKAQVPLREAREIRQRLDAFQKGQIQARKAHFEKELSAFKELLSKSKESVKEFGVQYVCAPCAECPLSTANKMLTPFMQALEKASSKGVVFYALNESVVFNAFLPTSEFPNGVEAVREALVSVDSEAAVRGKGPKVSGSTQAQVPSLMSLFKTLLQA
ncbi:alanyl-tRNA synthetase [Nematocida sp. AWRm77]|nr:alanyl-tRNA synthetase [Nematocida sp. AWRm77]